MEKENNSNKKEYGIVGYDVINTLTENGSVKRGICIIKDNHLVGLDESVIEQVDGVIKATSLVTEKEYIVDNWRNNSYFDDSVMSYVEIKSQEVFEEVITKTIEEEKDL